MKAVVLKVKDGRAAVLAEDGTTRMIHYTGERGDEIELDVTKPAGRRGFRVIDGAVASGADVSADGARGTNAAATSGRRGSVRVGSKRRVRFAAAAAAVAIVIFGAGGYSVSTVQAYSYVTMDVNPSFEYTLNRRNRVISVDALNDDAEAIVEQLNSDGIKGDTLDEAVDETLALLSEAGYLDGEDDAILFSFSGRDEKRLPELESAVTDRAAIGDKVEVTIEEATLAEREEAREQGISTGKYIREKKGLPETGEAGEEPSLEDMGGNGGAAVPDGESAPVPDGTNPPSDGQQPAEGMEPPSDGQTPPEGVEPSSDGQAPPERVEPPSDGQAPPEGVEPPSDWQTPPEGMEPPSGGQAPPEGMEPPSGGQTSPDGASAQ